MRTSSAYFDPSVVWGVWAEGAMPVAEASSLFWRLH